MYVHPTVFLKERRTRNAGVLVEKATSDLLREPDWPVNFAICDIINNDPGQAKDVIKSCKKRLGHRNPKVQLLSLTLLETMIKNCGEEVHCQVVEREILEDMVKIVRKKRDIRVRGNILVLLNSWQQAFGGPGGKYPQYFWAFDELQHSGVDFPNQIDNRAPVYTTTQLHPMTGNFKPSYAMLRGVGPRLDEAMAPQILPLSLSDMEVAHSGMEVLAEMLGVVDPSDKKAIKYDAIIELVEQCRSNQRNVARLVTTTLDEELLQRGLSLNDDLHRVLAKYDAIALGSPLTKEPTTSSIHVESANAPYKGNRSKDGFSQLVYRSSETDNIDHERSSQSNNSSTAQLALAAPPQPIKHLGTSDRSEQTLDLLSGEPFEDVAPKTPASPDINGMYGQLVLSPISQQQADWNSLASNMFWVVTPMQNPYSQQQQFYPSGSMLASSTVTSPQGQQIQQQLLPYSAQQHQNHPCNQSHVSAMEHSMWFANQSSYVVPWAVGLKPPITPLQNAMMYRSDGQRMESQASLTTASYPLPPLNVSSARPVLDSISSQQKGVLYENNTLLSSPHQYTPMQAPFYQQQRALNSSNFNSSPTGEMNSDFIRKIQNLSPQDSFKGKIASTNSQPFPHPKSFTPADQLFEDLVEMKSKSANFKTGGMSHSLSGPSSSKSGTL